MIKQNGTCNVKDPTNHSTNHLQPTMAIIWSHSNHQASLPPLLVVALKLGITHQTQKVWLFVLVCSWLLCYTPLLWVGRQNQSKPGILHSYLRSLKYSLMWQKDFCDKKHFTGSRFVRQNHHIIAKVNVCSHCWCQGVNTEFTQKRWTRTYQV